MLSSLPILLFCLITLILFSFSCLFFVPWLRSSRLSIAVIGLLLTGSYLLYGFIGNPKILKEYYKTAAITQRAEQQALRPQLMALYKSEYVLRLGLEREADNIRLQWQLLDCLAKRSMYQGAFKQALDYWENALNLLLKDPVLDNFHHAQEQRIQKTIQVLKSYV